MSSKNDKHKMYHVLILDRSGSMCCVQQETIDGFNQNIDAMLEDQRDEIEQYICLVTFANDVQMPIWIKSLDSVTKLNKDSYNPAGGTALYDAIGMAVAKLKNDIGDEIKAEKANVIITIFSDGWENASSEWRDFEKLKAYMDELRGSRMWTFTFIGCDWGSLKTARDLGLGRGNVMSFNAGGRGTEAAFRGLAKSRKRFTSGIIRASCMAQGDSTAFAESIDALQSEDFFEADKADEDDK